MDAEEISKVLTLDKISRYQFEGVFSVDELPNSVKYPSALVVNTDVRTGPGEHWVAFYFTDSCDGEFFDSFGQAPDKYNVLLKRFVTNNSDSWTYTTKQVQEMLSTTCGQHCLFYLLHRCRRVSALEIMHKYSNRPSSNDNLVTAFLRKYYNIHTKTHDLSFIRQNIGTDV